MSLINKLVNFNLVGLCVRQNSGRLFRDLLYPSSCRLSPAACSMSSREGCLPDDGQDQSRPTCSKKVIAQMALAKKKQEELKKEMKLKARREKAEKEKKERKPAFKSIWENPECCVTQCQNPNPRYDELHYHMSDKTRPKYTRTWVECPQLMILPKKVCQCEPEEYLLPPINHRAVAERPKTACSLLRHKDKMLMTKPKKRVNFKCVKINLRLCRKIRENLRCEIKPNPSNCQKICAPKPSYSECKKPRFKKLPRKECRCSVQNPLCELLAQYTKPVGKNKR